MARKEISVKTGTESAHPVRMSRMPGQGGVTTVKLLGSEERQQLETLIRKGKGPAREQPESSFAL